jgi:hypothetical protein
VNWYKLREKKLRTSYYFLKLCTLEDAIIAQQSKAVSGLSTAGLHGGLVSRHPQLGSPDRRLQLWCQSPTQLVGEHDVGVRHGGLHL